MIWLSMLGARFLGGILQRPLASCQNLLALIISTLCGVNLGLNCMLRRSVSDYASARFLGTSGAEVRCQANIAHFHQPRDFQPPVQ